MQISKKTIKQNWPIILILLIAFVIRIPLLHHCLWVDEARDMSISYNLFHNGSLTQFNGQWKFQHPIMQYLIIAPGAVVGSETIATLMITIMALISAFAVYIIGKELFNKEIGAASAFLLSMQPIFFFISLRILNDITHTTFVILSFMFLVLYYKRKEWKFAGLSLTFSLFALTTRITSFLLPFIIGALILFKDKKINKKIFKEKWIYYGILIGIIPGLIWVSINYIHTGKFFDVSVWTGHLKMGILDSAPWYYYIINFINIYTISLTVLFLISLVIHYLRKFKNTEILFIWFLLYFAIISWVAVKVPRYTLPTMAPLILISVSGVYYISKIKGLPKGTKYAILIIFLIIGSWWGYNGYALVKYKSIGFCGLKETAQHIGNHKTFAGSWNEISWYAKRNVYALPSNLTQFEKEVKPGDYIEVDIWERTQPKYIFNLIKTNQSNFKPIYGWPPLSNQKAVLLLEYVK